ncbi:hypothetical protein LIER_28581 [Lithospermum erythrorhizon]|uniref:Uncharacterized protein n=1 Tax=Lithospermum erythrorhizon TaxID=34254 RepID=A0AAV3RJS2_LITER
MADGIFFGLDEYTKPAVGLDELAGASMASVLASLALDGAASLAHRVFLASIVIGVEPRSYRLTLRNPGWCDAVKAEVSSLENNGTWSLVDLPKDKNALGSR